MKQLFLLVVLISSSMISATSAQKYAKDGCPDTCGEVRIPYPFGIGKGCSAGDYFTVECKSSTPYLPSLQNTQILLISLENQAITLNISTASFNCDQKSSKFSFSSLDLGEGSPFYYSRKHNKFRVSGCGNTASISEHGRVLTACSTFCANVSLSSRGNGCFGIDCCQTEVPYYLKSYTVDLMVANGGCGSAMLVDETFYGNGSFAPVVVEWRAWQIPSYLGGFYCYLIPETEEINLSDGNVLETYRCSCLGREGNPFLVDGCQGDTTNAPTYAKSGCQDKCGNITIPYPFGIGLSNCSIDKWYAIDCNSSIPYLHALNNLQVLDIDLENQTVTVNVSTTIDCQNLVRNSTQILGMDLSESPFLFSAHRNKFRVEGCGNAVMNAYGKVLSGCSANCANNSTSVNQGNMICSGINCCQTTIPYYLKSYSVDLSSLTSGVPDIACGSAFLEDDKFYTHRKPALKDSAYIPVALQWTFTSWQSKGIDCDIFELDMDNGSSIVSRQCYCQYDYQEGNPYLSQGCSYPQTVLDECKVCRDNGGRCRYPSVVTGEVNCDREDNTKSTLRVILGVSISMGVLLLIVTTFLLYKAIKITIDKRRRKRFFKRNGGLLLKQQQPADEGLIDRTRLFTSMELEKATDFFHESRILGKGGHGTVYKGMLTDGKIVAVKKAKVVDESQLEEFINEVVILSQVNHRNVVKLLGCCLETEVPLLVSEFIPNGTLHKLIHDESDDEFPITWNMRLQIASEVSSAVAYLHSATSIPIYHRDIKSTNILLDDKYRAKVSDFGTSRFVTVDQTHLTTMVKGTFGYLDPEYFQSSQFTEKSDVYSFGVVLVELLTGEMPISHTRFSEHRSLATYFLSAMEEGQVMSLIDTEVVKESSHEELMAVSSLAMRCLNLNGKFRPTMREVASELESIRACHVSSTMQHNTGQMAYSTGEELLQVYQTAVDIKNNEF